MLHAFNQKNVRRLLMRSQDEHTNEKSEDAVTSMVFSPLAFMTPVAALQVLTSVVGEPHTRVIGGRVPVRHTFELWPQGLLARSASADGMTRCEPDLVSTFEFEEGPDVTFIGEMKWDWKMAKADLAQELRRESEALSKRQTGYQIPFVISKYRTVREIEGAPIVTWMDVAHRLVSLSRRVQDGPVAAWSTLVRVFLEKADLVPFSGFVDLPSANVEWSRPVAFWSSVNV